MSDWIALLNEESQRKTAHEQERTIRRWLESTGEQNPDVIAEVLAKCRSDPEAQAYFLARSKEASND